MPRRERLGQPDYLASRDPANFPQADPIFSVKSMAPVAARNAPAGTSGRRDDASESDCPIPPVISRWPVSLAHR